VTRAGQPRPARRGRQAAARLALAFAGYLALSVVVWWHVWSSHPSGVTICGCNDPSLFVWFLEWPAYAMAHGHYPFFSTAIFHPTGIDLLSNTSVLAIGIPLAPVTWLFGPVATLNVASTLGPALTAFSMFWLLRRWVSWTPAAFIGGLVFGFSPFMVANLAVDHLMTSVLVLLPLMVACLDELLVRQRRRAATVGGALGLLVVVQFFVGTEVLVIVALSAVAGLVLLLVYGALAHRRELHDRLPHALRGLGVAAAVAVVLLAYPLWFTLDGPAHLSGLVWPSLVPGGGGIDLHNLWHIGFMSRPAERLFAGYAGPALPQVEFLGLGLLVVIGAGLVVWWRDRRLWFFGALGLVSVALSLGVQSRYWVPWRVLAHVPVVQNVTVTRFAAVTTLCAAVLLGIVVDRTQGVVVRWARSWVSPLVRPLSAVVGAGVALAVAAVATAPLGSAIALNVPLTTAKVTLPQWFTTAAPTLPSGQVVLAFPPPVAGAAAMTWQSVDGLHFALATGTGPESIAARAGPEQAGLDVLTSDSVVLSRPAPATARRVAVVRRALAGWGVTVVVVADPVGLMPSFDRTSGTAAALELFTAAIGRRPRFTDDAWVWSGVRSPGRPLAAPARSFARCFTQPQGRGARQDIPDCVVAASR
jgi:hypothetical protein